MAKATARVTDAETDEPSGQIVNLAMLSGLSGLGGLLAGPVGMAIPLATKLISGKHLHNHLGAKSLIAKLGDD